MAWTFKAETRYDNGQVLVWEQQAQSQKELTKLCKQFRSEHEETLDKESLMSFSDRMDQVDALRLSIYRERCIQMWPKSKLKRIEKVILKPEMALPKLIITIEPITK